ncbi:hypothetical protein RFX63_01460, partial [Acinetobacter baumannii]|nr:hypothetical protein [Acinetobacter baumannii]
RLMQGRLGRGVIKISAVAPEHRKVKAPAIVFDSQEAVQLRHTISTRTLETDNRNKVSVQFTTIKRCLYRFL